MQALPLQSILDSVAANVRRLRQRRHLTQEELAEAAGLDARYVQRVERGEVNMRLETLVRLAAPLGETPARLLRKATLGPPSPGRPRKAQFSPRRVR